MIDRDLKDLFDGLAEADRRRAPSFASVRARKAPSRPASALPAAAALAAGIALAVAVVRTGPDDSLRTAIARARAMASWSEPTSALLGPLDATMTSSVPTLTLLDEE